MNVQALKKLFVIALAAFCAWDIQLDGGFFCLIAVVGLWIFNNDQRKKSNYISSVKKKTFRWNFVLTYILAKLVLLITGDTMLQLVVIAVGTYFGYRKIKKSWNRKDVETAAAGWSQGKPLPDGAPALPTSAPTPTTKAPASADNGGTSSTTKKI